MFGVCWNPFKRDEYIVGCIDGSVQMCNMNKGIKPEKIFKGHEKRVFNVCYNSQVPDIFASGSDDHTIRAGIKI